MWYTSNVADHFGIDRKTVHNRAERFADFFSEFANPGKGKERRFDARDIAVMKFIHDRYALNMPSEEIERELHDATRDGEFASVNRYPTSLYGVDTDSTEPSTLMALVGSRAAMAARYDEVMQQLDEYKARADETTDLKVRVAELETELKVIKRSLWYRLFGGKE